MRFIGLLGGVVALLVLSRSVQAASQSTWNDCEASDPSRSIPGCTRILQDESEKATQKAIAYYNRGLAYRRKGNLDKAIADYTEASNLNPRDASALNNLGDAFADRGLFDTAIVLFTKAIRLDPKFALAYQDRSIAFLYEGGRGDLDRALADITKASDLVPDDAYSALWVDIVGQRSGLASRLAAAVPNLDMTKWPAPVVRLYLGQLTPGALFAAANDPDAQTKRAQLCEANFYLGELKLREGEKKDAAQLFQSAKNGCPPDFAEGLSAVCELRALGEMGRSK